jgi:hypothetical protein
MKNFNEEIEDYKINLLDPENCILDCNKGEKLITELNNHICLGEYELARTFFKQILEIAPLYIKYFYNIIFLRGIPDKWLLSNQIRTSANYLWLLYQDYINELKFQKNCPEIIFDKQFLQSNEFDLLITTAFYNSYENLDNYEMSTDFIKDLRQIYNNLVCLNLNKNFYLPKLRILSPNPKLKLISLTIDEYYFDTNQIIILDNNATSENTFIENMKNFVLTQPVLSKQIIQKMLPQFVNLKENEDLNMVLEIFHIIFVDLIMLFIHFRDYEKVYEYLKFIPFNPKNELCKSSVQLMFSVIISLTHNSDITPEEALKFTNFVIDKLNLNLNSYINNFKRLPFFNKDTVQFNLNNEIIHRQDSDRWLLRHKIYEALLSNQNEDLLTNLHIIEDFLIEFQTAKSEIPVFFSTYAHNLKKSEIFKNLTYEELINLIRSFSKFENSEGSQSYMWLKANDNIFWNEYFNFLRVYDEHCLGYALRESIKFVKLRKFDRAVELLHPLNNLKLLLILIVWSKFENDIHSRKLILSIFWESYLKYRQQDYKRFTWVPYFEDIIINLEYLINFSMWIQGKLSSVQLDPNTIYNNLLDHSIPFVIRKYMLDFDFQEMSRYLIDHFPISNQKLQKSHFHTTMIVISFYFYSIILKRIEDYFNNYVENNETPLFSSVEKEKMEQVLNKIVLVPYRLNIMGDIFKLIFIKFKTIIDKEHESTSQFLHQKNIFLDFVKFLKSLMKPLDNFDYDNLNNVFEDTYIDQDIYNMVKYVDKKEVLLEDLKHIDVDYLACNNEMPYKDFLILKSERLKSNVDELIFRFNIINNSWLEIIYEKTENNTFLTTILQNSQHYLQVCKKFHMWDIAKEVIQFFKLPDFNQNEIDLLKYFTELKGKLIQNDDNLNKLIDFECLNNLLIAEIKKKTEGDVDKALNVEYFKLIFDLSLSESISAKKSMELIEMAKFYLEKSAMGSENKVFFDIIEKYTMLIDASISKEQNVECLSKMISSTNNLGTISCAPLHIKNHFDILSTHYEALKALIEKVNQSKSDELPYDVLKVYFDEAYNTYIRYEEYNNEQNETKSKIMVSNDNKTTNYLKLFLQYLKEIGDQYHIAKKKYKPNGSNYLKLLKKNPNEIIAKLFLKYYSEEDALEVAKSTKTDLISVILEFTDYYKKSIINYSEYNIYFNELFANFENTYIFDNTKSFNLDILCEKEEWVKGNNRKTFPLTMRILEFVYNLSKKGNREEYFKFIPLFISLYRMDFDSLKQEEQVRFWELLIDQYMDVKIINNYIKVIFTKFYFYKTFYQKNQAFKHLYDKICNIQIKKNTEKVKNEKYSIYQKTQEKIKNNKFEEMLPKTFQYITTSKDYIGRLTNSMENYLTEKLKNKPNTYSKFSNFGSTTTTKPALNIKFHDIANLSSKKNISYYEDLCRGLLEQKQYDLALDIADKYVKEF